MSMPQSTFLYKPLEPNSYNCIHDKSLLRIVLYSISNQQDIPGGGFNEEDIADHNWFELCFAFLWLQNK